MHIIIDEQRPIEVTPVTMSTEDGGTEETLVFEDAHNILDAWVKLAPGRRGFRYGRDADDTEPSTIIIAEASNNKLDLFDIDPHWDGVSTRNAYRLVDLADTLPLRVVD